MNLSALLFTFSLWPLVPVKRVLKKTLRGLLLIFSATDGYFFSSKPGS